MNNVSQNENVDNVITNGMSNSNMFTNNNVNGNFNSFNNSPSNQNIVTPNVNNNVQSQNFNQQPQNNQSINYPKKKSNKALIIILIIVLVIAIASAAVALILVMNNKKTNNDFESNVNNQPTTTTTTTTSTESNIDYNGFIFNKRDGYTYTIEDEGLVIMGDTSAFEVLITKVPYSTALTQTAELEQMMDSYGYIYGNKKISTYDGINALSYEITYSNANMLYIICPTSDSNYIFEIAALNSTNTFDYNLINEAISLTSDATNSNASTYAKSDSTIGQLQINDSMLNN